MAFRSGRTAPTAPRPRSSSRRASSPAASRPRCRRARTGTTRATDPRAVDLYLRARAELRRFWGTHAQAAADLLDAGRRLRDRPRRRSSARSRTRGPGVGDALQAGARPCARARRSSAASRPATARPTSRRRSSSSTRAIRVGGGSDLGIALVRAPMSAQAHETAGRILVEVDGTARGAPPLRDRARARSRPRARSSRPTSRGSRRSKATGHRPTHALAAADRTIPTRRSSSSARCSKHGSGVGVASVRR